VSSVSSVVRFCALGLRLHLCHVERRTSICEGESKHPENASGINADSGSSHENLTVSPTPMCHQCHPWQGFVPCYFFFFFLAAPLATLVPVPSITGAQFVPSCDISNLYV
jgi:hypothetical protein